MTAWARLRRAGIGTAIPLFLLFVAPLSAADDPPKSGKPSKLAPIQIRAAAEAAEKLGDWDTAFTAYCHLYVADRTAPDVREKLNTALRRVQQLRRHRDPQFQQYTATTSVSDAMKLFGEVLTKVPVVYVDPDRATPQMLWENGIEELHRALGNPTFRQAFIDAAPAEKVEGFRTALRLLWVKQPIPSAIEARGQMRKLLAAAQEAFSVRVPSAVVIEMVCGACAGLDEYTIFLNPGQANPDSVSAVPDLSPQGIYLAVVEGALIIDGVATGSWAALHTPLRKGDRISRLNGRVMDMVTPAAVVEALRNPIDGFHSVELGMDAAAIQLPVIVPTVYGLGVVSSKEGIGYARIGSFTPNTPRELDHALNALKARGVRVTVLDLRGNLGGSFLASVETAKRLLPAGLIVTTQGQVGEVANRVFSSDSGMNAQDMPLVLLIDAETASAAEVLAAALKDNNRATLIGMPSFGKGAIQYPLKMSSLDDIDATGKPRVKSGTVRLTIAKLVAPRGGAINGVGISPHILEADATRQLDLALEKAAELLPSMSRTMMPTLPTVP